MYITRKQLISFLACLVILALIGIMGEADRNDQLLERDHYCEMVSAYMHDHNVGWPDYRHTYAVECRAQPRLPGSEPGRS